MIAFAPLHPPVLRLSLLGEAFRRDPLFAGAAVILALAMVPTCLAWAIDPRLVGGVAVWSKPLKFEAALAVYLGTLAWFARWLPPGFSARRGYRVFTRVVVVAVALEMEGTLHARGRRNGEWGGMLQSVTLVCATDSTAASEGSAALTSLLLRRRRIQCLPACYDLGRCES